MLPERHAGREWQHLEVDFSRGKRRRAGRAPGRNIGCKAIRLLALPTQARLPPTAATPTPPLPAVTSTQSQKSSRDKLQPYRSHLIAPCTRGCSCYKHLIIVRCWVPLVPPLSEPHSFTRADGRGRTRRNRPPPRPLVKKCLRSERASVETRESGQVCARRSAARGLFV